MKIEIEGNTIQINPAKPLNIAIPLDFYGTQPNAYGVERASSKSCEAGKIVGDTRRGGSVNFEQVKFIPHCNGTHTECVGHITHERISVNDCLKDAFVLTNLLSVLPEIAYETTETYSVQLAGNDKIITKKALENSLQNVGKINSKALIVRTLPNDEIKLLQTYLEEIPPFFSNDAMKFLVDLGVEHLLCDLPSIDRIYDEGKLSNHRIFWNVEQGSFEVSADSFKHHTITELIYVPNEIKDGNYLLNLQIAAFQADASPCRPILFELIDK